MKTSEQILNYRIILKPKKKPLFFKRVLKDFKIITKQI